MAVRPEADLARGEVYWHEVLGVPVRGLDGTELGVVKDIYRVAENEVYVVTGESFGTFDLPAVRAFIRIFAPRRGEIVVDADALGLEPPRQRRTDSGRAKAPRRTSRKRTSEVAADPADATEAANAPRPADATDAPRPAHAAQPTADTADSTP